MTESNTEVSKDKKDTNWQKYGFFAMIIIFVLSTAFAYYMYENQKNIIINLQIKNDTLKVQQLTLQEEIKKLKDPSSVIISQLKPNEVEHNGTLKIRILKNSEPIPFIGYSISCAKGDQPQYFKAATEKVVEIDNCEDTYINCKLSQQRWLLDRYKSPLLMPDYNIEINGKIIPAKKEYIIETENDGKKSADYVILLKEKK